MELVPIATTITIWLAVIGLVAWLFRPASRNFYEKASKIPLKDDQKILKRQTSGKRKKTRAK